MKTNFIGKNFTEEIEYEKPKEDISKWRHIGDGMLMNIETGEVKEIKPKTDEFRSDRSTSRSLRKINHLIFQNFFPECETVYSIDFTYAKQPENYEQFQKDLTKLKRRLQRIDPDVRLIIVKEKGCSDNYHGHMIATHIYLTKESFTHIWGLGSQIEFKIINSNEDLLYKSIYLTNIAKEYAKSYVKRINARTFPAHKKLYMATKNLRMPESVTSEKPLDRTNTTTVLSTPDLKYRRTRIKFETFKYNDDNEKVA